MSTEQTIRAAHIVRTYAVAARLAAGAQLGATLARIRVEVAR